MAQAGQEKEGSNELGAFIVGMAVGAMVMFFACNYLWKVRQASFNAARECGRAAVACQLSAEISKECR